MSKEDPIFFEAIQEALPEWMSLKPFRHWLHLGIAVALVVDALIEGLFAGRLAGFPGQVSGPGIEGFGGFDNIDALPLIGRDRNIARGFTESPADYARRLRQWRVSWRRAGTAFGMLEQLRGVLGPNPPTVRAVSADGVWWSIEADGSLVYNTPTGAGGFRISPDGTVTAEPAPAHPWDWDSASTPPLSSEEHERMDVAVIIYAPTNPPLDGDAGVYGDGLDHYGDEDGTIGTSTTPAHVDLIKGLLETWKASGIVIGWIIIAFDPASFDPLTPGPYPAAGMPDGTWGHWGKNVAVGGGLIERQRARLATARYWRGAPG